MKASPAAVPTRRLVVRAFVTGNVSCGRDVDRIHESRYRFAVHSSGRPTELTTLDINQQVAPNDFSEAGVSWDNLGEAFDVTTQTLTVQLSNAANGRVNADAFESSAFRMVRRSNCQRGMAVIDGASDVGFGAAMFGIPVTRTFIVNNLGGDPLTLQEPIDVPSGFNVVSSFDALVLGPGGSTNLSWRWMHPKWASSVENCHSRTTMPTRIPSISQSAVLLIRSPPYKSWITATKVLAPSAGMEAMAGSGIRK